VETTGIEPATSCLQSSDSPAPSVDSKALAPTPSPVCTGVCTSEAENANARVPSGYLDADQGSEGEGIDQGGAPSGSLAKLAAALLTLSPADRARLAAMLNGRQAEGRAE